MKLTKFSIISLGLIANLGLLTAMAEPTVAESISGSGNSQTSAEVPALASGPITDENGFYPGGPAYVSENASVWKRSGPTVNHGIIAGKHVGDKLTFLRYSENGKFVEIADSEGKGWMQIKDVQAQPCGKALVEILEEKIKTLENKLSNYDSEIIRQYQSTQKRMEKLENENNGMKKAIAEKDQTIQQLDKQRRDYEDRLQTKELDMQMRWWLQGAMIALGGAVVGIVFVFIPRPKRQRKKDRF